MPAQLFPKPINKNQQNNLYSVNHTGKTVEVYPGPPQRSKMSFATIVNG